MSVSGKFMTCKIDTVEIFDNYAWDANEGADVLERTSGRHLGYEAEDLGVYNNHITIKGYMDVVLGQYTPVRRGTIITNLKLFRLASDSAPAFAIPIAVVVSSRQGGEIKGKIEWNCEVHSHGPYTYADPAGATVLRQGAKDDLVDDDDDDAAKDDAAKDDTAKDAAAKDAAKTPPTGEPDPTASTRPRSRNEAEGPGV